MAKQKFTPVMRIIAHADLPLPGDSTEAMLEGAKRNRALVIAMAKLGYLDTEISVRMNHRRVPSTDEPTELPPLPGQDQIERAIAEGVAQFADDGTKAMARKLAR